MEYTIDYLLDNFNTLPVEQHFEILAQLSIADKQLYRQRAFSMPSEVTEVDNQRAARSHNIAMENLSRTTDQYKEITRKAMETMGEEGLKSRAQKLLQTLGEEGLKARGQKIYNTLGKEGRKARSKKTVESMGKEGCRDRSFKAAQKLGEEGCRNRALNAAKTKALKLYNSLSDSEKLVHDNQYCPHCSKDIGIGYSKRKLGHINHCKKRPK